MDKTITLNNKEKIKTLLNLKIKKTRTTTADKYILLFFHSLEIAKTKDEKLMILNKIYSDGFEDGYNEKRD